MKSKSDYMRNYRDMYIVSSISSIYRFMFFICGYMVQNYVQKKCKTLLAFTQFTQIHINTLFSMVLYTFLYSTNTQSLHTIIIPILSVRQSLYTFYTCTTTTTMYIINKRIVI